MINLSSLFIKTAFLSGLATSLTVSLPALAQVGMSPLFIEAEAVRGRAQGVVTLINSTDRPIRARVYSEPFTFEKDGFTSLIEDADDLAPYLQFSPREVVIAPQSEQRVRLLGQFPPSLPAGEYRAAIFAEELLDSANLESSVAIKARVGTTVYMRQGRLSPDLSGLSAVVEGQSIELLVANQGQATARPSVQWTLLQDGVEIASGEEGVHTVVAEGDRNFSLPLPTALPAGNYSLTGEFVWMTLDAGYTEAFELPVLVP